MSNLIQYIVQEDPEEELKKKQSQTLLSRELSSRQDTDKNYKFNSRHLLENDFSHLQYMIRRKWQKKISGKYTPMW